VAKFDTFVQDKVLQGFSEEAANIMAASVRPRTGLNYEYRVQLYQTWCNKHHPNLDPFTAPAEVVVNFLAYIQQDRDLGQSAVAGYRSAISKVHHGKAGASLGTDLDVQNLVRGVGNVDPDRRARKPRYSSTWSVSQLLEELSTWDVDSLSIMDLTVKTLSLLALATISRVSTLNILSRKYEYRENPLEPGAPQLFIFFLPGTREKTGNREGIFLAPLVSLQTNLDCLDPVLHLLQYVTRTRKAMLTLGVTCPPDHLAPLWVATRKPFHPVKTCTISGWFKKGMTRAGLDTSVFKTHSSRAAASAFHKSRNLGLSTILDRGGWKPDLKGSSRVFLIYYDRKVRLSSSFSCRSLESSSFYFTTTTTLPIHSYTVLWFQAPDRRVETDPGVTPLLQEDSYSGYDEHDSLEADDLSDAQEF